MPNQDTRFEFLTMAEFNQLPRREKIAYLEEAVAAVMEKYGDFTEQSLFKDGPPALPPRGKGANHRNV
jgi:hypothetical protein